MSVLENEWERCRACGSFEELTICSLCEDRPVFCPDCKQIHGARVHVASNDNQRKEDSVS